MPVRCAGRLQFDIGTRDSWNSASDASTPDTSDHHNETMVALQALHSVTNVSGRTDTPMVAAAFAKIELRMGGTSTSGWQGELWQQGFHLRYEGNPLAPLQAGTPSTYEIGNDEETETTTIDGSNVTIIWRQYQNSALVTPAGQEKQIALVDQVLQYWTATAVYRPVWAQLREVRITHCVLPGGKAVNSTSNRFLLETPRVGTASGGAPPQLAIAISLVGKSALSRRGKGRMFHGPVSSVFTGNGNLPTSYQNALPLLTRDMIRAINLAPGLRVANVSLTNNQFYDVSQVRCGDLYDTQRRRRAQRAEVYQSEDV